MSWDCIMPLSLHTAWNVTEIIPLLHLRANCWLQICCRESRLLALEQYIFFKLKFCAITQNFLPKHGSLCISNSSVPSIFLSKAVGTGFITWEKCPAHTPRCCLKQTKKLSLLSRESLSGQEIILTSVKMACAAREVVQAVFHNQLSAGLQCRVEYMEYNFPPHLHLIQWLWTTHYLKKKKKRSSPGTWLSLMACYSSSTVSSVQNDSVICVSPKASICLPPYPPWNLLFLIIIIPLCNSGRTGPTWVVSYNEDKVSGNNILMYFAFNWVFPVFGIIISTN